MKPSIFPVPPCVVFGKRGSTAKPLSNRGQPWTGRVPKHNASWAEASPGLTIGEAPVAASASGEQSPYAASFSQGATVVPRMLFVVEDVPASPLGAGPGRRSLRSRRSNNEKAPWKTLPALSGSVEEEFVFPMHIGETIAPFRPQQPLEVVIPWVGDALLDVDDERFDDYPGLAQWWRSAVGIWHENRSSDRLSLLDQLDYRGKLTRQFPTPAHRVVYTGKWDVPCRGPDR